MEYVVRVLLEQSTPLPITTPWIYIDEFAMCQIKNMEHAGERQKLGTVTAKKAGAETFMNITWVVVVEGVGPLFFPAAQLA